MLREQKEKCWRCGDCWTLSATAAGKKIRSVMLSERGLSLMVGRSALKLGTSFVAPFAHPMQGSQMVCLVTKEAPAAKAPSFYRKVLGAEAPSSALVAPAAGTLSLALARPENVTHRVYALTP